MSLIDGIKFVFTFCHTFFYGVTGQTRSRNVLRGLIVKSQGWAWRFVSLNPAFIMASGLIVAIFLTYTPEPEPEPEADMDKAFSVKALVISLPEKTPYGYQLTLKPISLRQEGMDIKLNKKILLRLPAGADQEPDISTGELSVGDTLLFRGIIERPSYNLLPGIADRRITASLAGTPFIIRLKSLRQIKEIIPPLIPENYIFKYLKNFILFIEKNNDEETVSLLRALLMGQKQALPVPVREQLNRLGLTHLFVISGFHIGVFAAILHFLIRRIGSFTSILVVPTVIWVYVWLIGFPVPASRAVIIFTLFMVIQYFGFQGNLLNTLGIAVLALLSVSPTAIFLPGFQLTFICLLAIISLAIPLISYLDSPLHGYRAFVENQVITDSSPVSSLTRITRTWFEDYFHHVPEFWRKTCLLFLCAISWPVKVMGCTSAIQFILLPLLVYYFNCFNFFSLPATALFIPFVSVLVFTGMMLFLLWWSSFSFLLGLIYQHTGLMVIWMLDCLDTLFPPIYLPQPGLSFLAIYYIFLLFMLLINPSRGWIFPLLALVVFFSYSRTAESEPEKNVLAVSMLDVGQGDCFHLKYPDGKSGLIDAGGTIFRDNDSFIGKNLIARYLWESGVNKLEYLLITHPEKDHSAGYPFLDMALGIKKLYFHDFHNSYKTSKLRLSAGDSFTVGGVHHQVLWPEENSGSKDNLNDRSLVLLLTYGHFKMLFSGDISADIERTLLKKHKLTGVKVLKAAHHGSNSSSCRAFLSALQAETALISAGRRNAFGHPSSQVLKRMREAGMQIYTTPKHGSVRILTDGFTWKFSRLTTQ